MNKTLAAPRERWKSGYKDTVRKALRKWQLENPEKYRAQRERAKKKRQADPDAARIKWRENNKRRRMRDPHKVKADKKKSYMNMKKKHPELIRARNRARREKVAERDWAKRLVTGARNKSKIRGHADFSISACDLEELWQRQEGRCYWTGIPMVRVQHNILTASMDRLDNSVGYTVANIVLATWGANRARGNAAVHIFEEFLGLIRDSANMVEQVRKAGIPVRTIPLPAPIKK